jgi:hypothetical protein
MAHNLVSYVKNLLKATLPNRIFVWVSGNGFTGEPAYNEYLDDTGAGYCFLLQLQAQVHCNFPPSATSKGEQIFLILTIYGI